MAFSGNLTDPLSVGGVTLRNRVFLAPMSGVTDDPFRRRAFQHGAGLVVSEMVASGNLAGGRDGSRDRIRHSGLFPHMVQLAGRDALPLAEAARIAEGEGADIIDINMGCPSKKVTGGLCGSALMRDPDHALALVEAVIGAVRIPVTVKMRLGWDETALNAPLLARRAEQAGVAMVTVHGRTRCQFYQGKADWRAIARISRAVTIPVVANGDVQSAADALEILRQSGADAVMIGRGHYGQPWLAGSIVRDLGGGGAGPLPETRQALAAYVVGHHEDMLSFYGVHVGLRQARKHLGWYLDRFASGISRDDRLAIMTSDDPSGIARRLHDVLCREELFEAAA